MLDGCLTFNGCLLPDVEWNSEPGTLDYVDASGNPCKTKVPKHAYAFTFCRVPVLIYQKDTPGIQIHFADGTTESFKTLTLPKKWSQSLFMYTGKINTLSISFETKVT